eukprot:CAMPEP_0113724208 /NCGR_PEP_ID=MMETSP0038_2-20120614/38922_1 /TAXON_ID=2898 /ORGANISM="Cryptomonas paramecium" /LENGTH=131 /DNA_ID=CAMNT_0000654025 /DNA_START=67 /DNA_END=458 /DNA_ORIENTATION=+ /assembly_acc=CAM_ASM_000170
MSAEHFVENDTTLNSLRGLLKQTTIQFQTLMDINSRLASYARHLKSENENALSHLGYTYGGNHHSTRNDEGSAGSCAKGKMQLPNCRLFQNSHSILKLRGGVDKDTASKSEKEAYDYDYFVIGGGSGGVRS